MSNKIIIPILVTVIIILVFIIGLFLGERFIPNKSVAKSKKSEKVVASPKAQTHAIEPKVKSPQQVTNNSDNSPSIPVENEANYTLSENYNYRKIFDFRSGRALVLGENYRYGYITENYKPIRPGIVWESAQYFYEGYAEVSDGYNWGFINKYGKLIGNGLEWSNTMPFNEGKAPVSKNGKWGFINIYGRLLFGGLRFDAVSMFKNNKALVEINNSDKMILSNGVVRELTEEEAVEILNTKAKLLLEKLDR